MAHRTDIKYIHMYTQGSAARKIEPVAPWKTMNLPRIKKQKRVVLHVDPVAILGIVVAAVMLIAMFVGVAQLRSVQQEASVMEQYVDTLKNDNNVLEDAYNSIDLQQIEQMALALGMVPAEQVQNISIRVEVPERTQTPSFFDQIRTFLTGLFA